jgi:hypothetical protein
MHAYTDYFAGKLREVTFDQVALDAALAELPEVAAALRWCIVAITDERIRQILTAAAKIAGLKKKLSPPTGRGMPTGRTRTSAGPRRPPSAIAWPCLAEHDGPLPQFFARAANTKRAYAADFARFLRVCARIGCEHLPAESETLTRSVDRHAARPH